MMMLKHLHPRDDVDICQGKKDEVDLPALKKALMHRYGDSKTK